METGKKGYNTCIIRIPGEENESNRILKKFNSRNISWGRRENGRGT